MARVTHSVSSRRRHKRTIRRAKGAWGKRSKIYRRAKETVYRGMAFATRDRKARKRDFRRLWIHRIRAGCEAQGMPYSRFMAALKAARVALDRKILADLAVRDEAAFHEIVELARGASPKPALSSSEGPARQELAGPALSPSAEPALREAEGSAPT